MKHSNSLAYFTCNIEKKYKIESKAFSNGTYGDVYKGTRIQDNLQVAIKKLKKIDYQKSLLRELNLLANIEHPFCLKLINFSLSPERVIVTPYMRNGTLDDLLKNPDPKLFSPTQKMCSIYALCSTMSFLHSIGIIHRDLKPSNIFIQDNKDICIADFGSSRKVEKNVDITLSPNATPLHASPEIIIGQLYTNSVDVYSFGVIFYQFFSYEAKLKNVNELSPYILMDKIVKGERFVRPPGMSDEQCSIYVTCTNQNDSERPTFEELARKFETCESLWFKDVNKEEYLNYISRCKQINHDCKIKKEHFSESPSRSMSSSSSSLTSSIISTSRRRPQRTTSSLSHKIYEEGNS